MNNTVAHFDGFYISYNPNVDHGFGLGLLFRGESIEETALCVYTEDVECGRLWYILNGNFFAEMKAAAEIGGLIEVMNFFVSHAEHRSVWSTPQTEQEMGALLEHLVKALEN